MIVAANSCSYRIYEHDTQQINITFELKQGLSNIPNLVISKEGNKFHKATIVLVLSKEENTKTIEKQTLAALKQLNDMLPGKPNEMNTYCYSFKQTLIDIMSRCGYNALYNRNPTLVNKDKFFKVAHRYSGYFKKLYSTREHLMSQPKEDEEIQNKIKEIDNCINVCYNIYKEYYRFYSDNLLREHRSAAYHLSNEYFYIHYYSD